MFESTVLTTLNVMIAAYSIQCIEKWTYTIVSRFFWPNKTLHSMDRSYQDCDVHKLCKSIYSIHLWVVLLLFVNSPKFRAFSLLRPFLLSSLASRIDEDQNIRYTICPICNDISIESIRPGTVWRNAKAINLRFNDRWEIRRHDAHLLHRMEQCSNRESHRFVHTVERRIITASPLSGTSMVQTMIGDLERQGQQHIESSAADPIQTFWKLPEFLRSWPDKWRIIAALL